MNLNHIKTAMVDFDGTLLDSMGCWIEAYRLLCKQKNMNPSQKVIDSFNKIDFREWQNLIFLQLGECFDGLLECAKTAYIKRTPKKAVLSIIESLPKSCSIIIVSKEPRTLIAHWLAFYKLECFSNIKTLMNERGNPEYYDAENLLLLDDNYKHCLAAKLADATVVGVDDYHTKERKAQMRELCDIYIENQE